MVFLIHMLIFTSSPSQVRSVNRPMRSFVLAVLVTRIGKKIIASTSLVGKSEGKKPLERYGGTE